jgi:hypothetical protein
MSKTELTELTELTETELTETELRLLKLAPLQSNFPIKFNTKSEFAAISCKCAHCGKTLFAEFVRGEVTRPIPSVAVIDAVGVCAECKGITTFFYRLHSNMSVSTVYNGKWLMWDARSQGAKKQSKLVLTRRFTGFLLKHRNFIFNLVFFYFLYLLLTLTLTKLV